MKAIAVAITLALLAGCGILEPKQQRVVVTLQTCCEYDSDSAYVGVPFPLLVLNGPTVELDHDYHLVEAKVRSEHCAYLYVDLVAVHPTGIFGLIGERGERLFSLRLDGCGEFVLEVDWAENVAVVRELG